MSEMTPEVIERMVKLVRRMSERAITVTPGLVPAHGFPDFYEARAIVADLPAPIDPDLVEARRVAADHAILLDPTFRGSWEEAMIAGQLDKGNMVNLTLAGIKRGRTLATPATSA